MTKVRSKSARMMRGFTLLELMAVIAISAILMAIGVPNFYQFIQNQRLVTITNDFYYALGLARSEALKRGTRVDLVPITGDDWSRGWVLFVNPDHLQAPRDDDQRNIVHRYNITTNGLTSKTLFTDNSHQYIAYNGSGRSQTQSAQQPQLAVWEFTLNQQSRLVKAGFLGRARVCNPAITPKTCQFNITTD